MQRPINPTKPHVDLLVAAKTLICASPYQITLAFVRGHQDTGNPTVLTHDTWLNVEVDLIAKETVNKPFVSPQFHKLPGNPWGCYMEKRCIIKQLDSELRRFINGKATLQYWSQQKQCDKDTLNKVDWMLLGRAMRGIPLAKRRWASKQMSSHFAHGKNMVCWKQ